MKLYSILNTPNSVIRNELGFVWQKAENENVHCAFTEFGHWYIVNIMHDLFQYTSPQCSSVRSYDCTF